MSGAENQVSASGPDHPPRSPGYTPGQPYYGVEGADSPNRGGLSAGAIVGIVLGGVFLVGAIIAAVVLFIALDDDDRSSFYDDAYTEESIEIMYFEVNDGMNFDDEQGCFFILRAGRGVDIDPSRYTFYVAERGYSPQRLDFSLREYSDSDPYGPKFSSGDRNATYDYAMDGKMWSDGEYLGFDMPMKNNPSRPMNIDITSGNIYEVMIKNSKGEMIYSDTFVYNRSHGFK